MRSLAFLLAFLLAGCVATENPPGTSSPATSPTTQPEPTGKAFTTGFENLEEGVVPPGWTPMGGSWGGQGDGLLRGAGEAEPGLSSLVATAAGTFRDFEAQVRFRMDSGNHPQGAGLVFHVQDARNYQIVRYSISENGWHLFIVDEGNRDKKSEATVEGTSSHPQFGDWVDLRVRVRGGHVEAFAGAEKVLDYHLPSEASPVGGVGVFVRGDTLALFDSFSVAP